MNFCCPSCNASISLEAAMQDGAARELVATMASMPPALARLLLSYLSLFRPAKQQLGWGRALRLVRDVVELEPDQAVLEAALADCTRSLDEKRAQGGWKALGNHNYLLRCLESASGRAGAALSLPAAATAAVPRSQAGSALVSLEGMKRGVKPQ